MKKFIITPNIKFSKKRGIIYNIEKNWFDYAKKLKIDLIVYNFNNSHLDLIKQKKVKGVIFSGGNNLKIFENIKENSYRDKEEKKLFKYVLRYNLPILATCRGFQLIMNIYKQKIIPIKNHVKKNHKLILNQEFFNIKDKKLNVNSFHNYAVKTLYGKIIYFVRSLYPYFTKFYRVFL